MITVLGIGPGSDDLMLSGYQRYLDQADLVIGSRRQLGLFEIDDSKQKSLPKLSRLREFLQANLNRRIVLLASGDPLLYGIGNWAITNFGSEHVKVVPGISSIQYLFNQLGLSMNDTYLTSSHGRQPDFDFLLAHQTVGMVTDQVIGPYQIAQEIKKRGQHRRIYVGELLSYPEEKISTYTEATVENRDYQMNAVIITNA